MPKGKKLDLSDLGAYSDSATANIPKAPAERDDNDDGSFRRGRRPDFKDRDDRGFGGGGGGGRGDGREEGRSDGDAQWGRRGAGGPPPRDDRYGGGGGGGG
eukprot:CAMPEP_0182565316 /NCGR_PEP_ID=MMETSP1324-20130603/7067_1 /TAXON_ID=236786 /ORGANISM="Florenciella sp., Strain RCC1587" /LENGTH=100 /DNA_ID=CAMNT_0024778951 /DNA_START=172 /DNA_END=471 /DNA_ORIENTATION=+